MYFFKKKDCVALFFLKNLFEYKEKFVFITKTVHLTDALSDKGNKFAFLSGRSLLFRL